MGVTAVGISVLASLGIGLAILAGYRWLARRWRVAAVLLACGVMIRAVAGLSLFWISWLDAPFLRSFHMGNGFWHLAPDALDYFLVAAQASIEGLSTIHPTSASPIYIATLALWMRATGISPASALLLNVSCYVLACLLVARCALRRGEGPAAAGLLPIAALTLSPALILFGTQSLKDQLFCTLIVVAGTAVFDWLVPPTSISRHRLWHQSAAFVTLAASVYLMAGMRAYYALLIAVTAGAGPLVWIFRGRARTWPRALVTSAVAWSVLWIAFMTGAGAYYPYYGQRAAALMPRAVQLVSAQAETLATPLLEFGRRFSRAGRETSAVQKAKGVAREPGAAERVSPQEVDQAAVAKAKQPDQSKALTTTLAEVRRQFARSGGATNVAATQEAEEAGRDLPEDQPIGVARGLLTGYGLLFVPISMLRVFRVVDFAGGRGLLPVTDLDTLFIDITLLVGLAMLLKCPVRPALRANAAYAVVLASLFVLTATLMAYVVVNFGTLFRLRLLIAVPGWLLALAARRDAAVGALENRHASDDR